MAFGCFGFAVSYIVAIRDCMPQIFAFLPALWGADHWATRLLTDGSFWTVAYLALLIPLALSRSVDDIWWFDGACLISVIYQAIYVVVWAALGPSTGSNPVSVPSAVTNPIPVGLLGLSWETFGKQFEALPIFFFAFACQQNVGRLLGLVRARMLMPNGGS
jgi:amino acid permease